MTITDLTSMGTPQPEQQEKIMRSLEALSEKIPNNCFLCAKCTSGCEAHKLLELEPHHIVALTRRGFIDEMVNSDIIWTCVTCFKCKQRCPQEVAPVEILFLLKNLAIASGKQVPGEYTQMLQNVMMSGMIQNPKEVRTSDKGAATRQSLGLPELKGANPMDFQQGLQAAMTAQLDTL